MRNIFNEGNEDVSKKAFVAINNNLNVIICVGESLEQREQDRHLEVVSNQLSACLKNIMKKDIHRVIIAYEPVWAIGTGKNATASQAEEMHKHIRSKIKEIYDDEIAENTRILYGGSVSIENYEEILSSDEVDGALIGGTSLDPEKFGKIAKFSSQS